MPTAKVNKVHLFLPVAAITGILLLFLVGYKAAITSFTHDESFTYTHYVHQTFMEIISYADPFPNNHILNSLLMKLSERCFGSRELALRLPGLLALALYLEFAFRLVRRVPALLALPAFLLLLANPYLLDFFGLARGYGLSMGFMMLSLYSCIRSLQTGRRSHLAWCHTGALLAVVSNFSMVNYYLAMVGTWYGIWLLSGQRVRNRQYHGLRPHLIHLLFLTATTLIVWEPLRKVTALHLLDFGGKQGIVADTVRSLTSASLYDSAARPSLITILSWTAACLFLSILLYSLIALVRDRRRFLRLHPELAVVHGVLTGIIAASLLEHYLLGQDFFMGRFALFLYPLFILNLAFFGGSLMRERWGMKTMPVVLWVLAAVFLIHTARKWDLTSYLDWQYDRHTRKVMTQVEQHYLQAGSKAPVSMGVTWLFEPSVNFYRQTRHLSWLQPADRNGFDPADHYYYIVPRDTTELPQPGKSGQHQLLFTSPDALLIYNRK